MLFHLVLWELHSCFQANTLAAARDMIEAQRMSHRAKNLMITSIVIGVTLTILAFVFRLTHDYDQ
jgi:multisubunit Na+/H+ antiporter MnhC subunit